MAPRPIPPIRHPIEKRVRVPASKSVTNRELVLSALAAGRSRLEIGPLDPGDDVRAMQQALVDLGYEVSRDAERIVVRGSPTPPGRSVTVDAGDGGTVARFGLALAALGGGRVTVDGSPQLRRRPIAALVDALRALGATAEGEALPITVSGPLAGGEVAVSGAESSQFASALLLAAPRTANGVRLRITGPLVSEPFVELTVAALEARGVEVARPAPRTFEVRPQEVRARDVEIPGDVTAATYPAAAAAILGGSVTVENVDASTRRGAQGDARFFDLLRAAGCAVDASAFGGLGVTVRRTGALFGVTADVRDCSDVFPTLAVIGACASTPTELTGIGHTRRQESDRVAAVAAGLRALGASVTEYADAIRVEPAPLAGGVVDARGDHRIAMAFAVLGLQVPGVAIEGADAVTKTYPGFFDMLRELA
ncbi:MAG TPA: 3-phosphoshikimate 1-carboxyvinyltransferase [Candidatus Limnocylindria bacterium]|nr:3-phosphoshikimate 1-carboxyvinyltransferase [Candidatus Limnocylindria bacterium]